MASPLAQIWWDTSPVVFEIGPLSIHWYGLLFATGFLAGYSIVQRMFRREGRPEQDLEVLLLYVFVATVLGARLGHVLFYDPVYYFSRPYRILEIWEGGLASHGGAIGIFIALYLYARRRPDQPYLWVLDRIAVPTALAGSLIRLGNFFNSEIIGVPADVPWAVVFARIDSVPRHPAQLYESVAYLTIFIALFLWYRRRKGELPDGYLTGSFLTAVFTARFLIEFAKVRQEAFELGIGLSMGQLLSIPMVLAGVALIAWARRRRRISTVAGRPAGAPAST
ncbi:MAG: prolipoprotein diacylglyceryl transferase [Bacteroidota bacterium]